MPLGISVTDLEIEEAIREAWAVLSAGSAASPSARRLAAALLALTGGTQAHPHWTPPMTCGATGWPSSPTKAPGWRAGVLDWGSRAARCLLSCCRKAKRGARTPMPCGARPRGPVPMLTARAKPQASRVRDRRAGMMPNKPDLLAREPGGADRPNPMVCGIEQPRGRADLSALPALSQAGGFDQVDAEAAALITASARYWTSGATCLSDSRSLSVRLPSRETRRITPCPSLTPAPAAAIQPPAPSRPISRDYLSDVRWYDRPQRFWSESRHQSTVARGSRIIRRWLGGVFSSWYPPWISSRRHASSIK
jgi:hypothetical protein